MKYMGSKARFAENMIAVMDKSRKPDMPWVELFVGGGNMISEVSGPRIGVDSNPHTIEALKSIRDCLEELPKNNKEFTEEDYFDLKAGSDYTHGSFAGFAYSYAGKWLAGWARDRRGGRDYVAEAYRNAQKQAPKLQNVHLECADYREFLLPDKCLLYLDPPYKGTTKYHNSFNHEEFYKFCRNKADQGHVIFVSEYNMPEDFIPVWSKETTSSLTQQTGSKKATEKLFTLI